MFDYSYNFTLPCQECTAEEFEKLVTSAKVRSAIAKARECEAAIRQLGVKDINFKASPEFIREVKRETDRDLERDMGGVKVIRKQLYSREERIARALEVIEKNGVLTLGDYASINNLSRTAASMELKEITADRTSPIGWMGSGSHKVWVKRKE